MAATDLFTLADLKLQVALNLGATDDVSLAKCGKYINRALLRFQEMGIWSFQEVFEQSFPGGTGGSVTVNGQKTYSIPECLEVTSLFMSSPIQRRLVLLGHRDYRRMYPNDTAKGTPYYYLRRGKSGLVSPATFNILKIGLYPIPDAAYTLKWDGYKKITLLTSDTDDVRTLSGIPEPMVDLVIEMATAVGWKEIDDGDAAAQMQECMARLKGFFNDDNHSIEDVHVLAPLDGDNLDKIFDPILPPNFGE